VGAGAAELDAADLHRVRSVGRHLLRAPGRAGVVRTRDVELPRAGEGLGLVVPGGRGAEEGHGRAAGRPGDDLREGDAPDPERRTDVDRGCPHATQLLDRDLAGVLTGHVGAVLVPEVGGVGRVGVDRGVAVDGGRGVGYEVQRPRAGVVVAVDGDALVGRVGEQCVRPAALVGHHRGAVGAHPDVAVQATAAVDQRGADRVDGVGVAEGPSAVEGDRAEGRHDGLRAVVDGVGVAARRPGQRACGEGAAADGLVVDARGRYDGGRGGRPVVVRADQEAGATGELRDEGAAQRPVGEQDRVQRRLRGGDGLVRGPGRGVRGLVEGHRVRGEVGLVVGHAGLPVGPDRGLHRVVVRIVAGVTRVDGGRLVDRVTVPARGGARARGRGCTGAQQDRDHRQGEEGEGSTPAAHDGGCSPSRRRLLPVHRYEPVNGRSVASAGAGARLPPGPAHRRHRERPPYSAPALSQAGVAAWRRVAMLS